MVVHCTMCKEHWPSYFLSFKTRCSFLSYLYLKKKVVTLFSIRLLPHATGNRNQSFSDLCTLLFVCKDCVQLLLFALLLCMWLKFAETDKSATVSKRFTDLRPFNFLLISSLTIHCNSIKILLRLDKSQSIAFELNFVDSVVKIEFNLKVWLKVFH